MTQERNKCIQLNSISEMENVAKSNGAKVESVTLGSNEFFTVKTADAGYCYIRKVNSQE